jgi:ribosomal protein L30E
MCEEKDLTSAGGRDHAVAQLQVYDSTTTKTLEAIEMTVTAPRTMVATLLIGAVAMLGIGASGAASGPGSASQIAADVAASLSVNTLPSNLSPSLANASKDIATVGTPALAACNTTGTTLTPSKCVFGDKTGSKTMVLWGDSHAFMWFPAVNAVAKADHWKLVALLKYGCPVASVSVWNPLTKSPYLSCNVFRRNMIATINKLNPSLVIVSEQFTSQAASGGGAFNTISTAQWGAGLKTTLKSLHSSRMKKVVIGDTVSSTFAGFALPPQCVAGELTSIQKCTISDSAAQQAQRAAESGAAKSESTRYLNVLPWLCASSTKPSSCSPIVGDAAGYRFVYYSTGHITETYALWLSSALGTALKPSL